jgi:hypothetical protein
MTQNLLLGLLDQRPKSAFHHQLCLASDLMATGTSQREYSQAGHPIETIAVSSRTKRGRCDFPLAIVISQSRKVIRLNIVRLLTQSTCEIPWTILVCD